MDTLYSIEKYGYVTALIIYYNWTGDAMSSVFIGNERSSERQPVWDAVRSNIQVYHRGAKL